jgi:hypothetical protein
MARRRRGRLKRAAPNGPCAGPSGVLARAERSIDWFREAFADRERAAARVGNA